MPKVFDPPNVMGDESIMSEKEHGTSATPVQQNLRWNVDRDTADRICNYNRHYAEFSGYFETVPKFLDECRQFCHSDEPKLMTFYDSNTGRPLFEAPKDRTWDEFLSESRAHGWPSFRASEVNWDRVRVLSDGETVSLDGTHLGHNLPDQQGDRYCINLVSVAGKAASNEAVEAEHRGVLSPSKPVEFE
eukprot:CAMPEP_0194027826 /NCGR_PEP_ID=MMETSP0009_2-20130614/1874_1 /TAXON_ID=210454 /ORGANISM="Grammatophora oceanica, Strain CCMP 410" /LENGTH=188 /DNA_ID=CAMNT_0038666999 /DNA_START=138 /DNA_END=705 /DNA_ORIENTATION=-